MTPTLLSLLSSVVLRYRLWQYGRGGYSEAARWVDCSSLTAAVVHLRYGWGDPAHARTRSSERWADLAVWRGRGAWPAQDRIVSDLHAGDPHLVAGGPTYPGPVDLWPGRIHLCQGWDRLGADGQPTDASRGHAWLWAADGRETGWVVESSGVGPRLWCAAGKIPLAEAIDEDGTPREDWRPMAWGVRAGTWERVSWVVLP